MTGPAIILDLETRPDPLIAQSEQWWTRVREGIEAPSNWKDQVKIQGFIDEAEQKLRERMALSARTGLIVMIGVRTLRSDLPSDVFRVEEETRESEAEMLNEFIDWLPAVSTRLLGWNIKKFDLPFLTARCLVHQIELPQWWPTPNNYRVVTDLMDVLGGPLDEWSFVLRGYFKDVSGADLLKLSLDDLEHHLRDDLVLTSEIATWTESIWGQDER